MIKEKVNKKYISNDQLKANKKNVLFDLNHENYMGNCRVTNPLTITILAATLILVLQNKPLPVKAQTAQ